MGWSVLCGVALGLMLNLAADWLPRRVLRLRDGGEASRPSGWTARRLARWVALLLLSVGLVLHLHSSATASLHLLGEPVGAGRGVSPFLERGTASLPLLGGVVPALTYCSLLLLIATIDLEHHLVPNVLILAGLILAMAFSLLSPLGGSLLQDGVPRLTTAVTGAAVGGGLFLLLALARRNALGAGDVKLAFLIGMLTGFPWVLQALVLGVLLGGLAAALLLLFRLRGPKHYIPYAPYLVAGAMVTLLYGPHIAQRYATLVLRLASLLRPAFCATASNAPSGTLETTALRALATAPRVFGGVRGVAALARLAGVGG